MSSQRHTHEEHEQILRELEEQFRPLFEQSPVGVYLYVTDVYKICNERMAQMHGMTVEEWRNAPTFLNDFIAEEDRQMYARNYRHHVAGLRHPITFRFHGLRKDGSTFAAETDMIPLCWNGHAVAYHFVREIS
ncbi:MAG TPA: PAS domain S-box protein [Anaerolineales bacterium]|nr:PAS domain S-box protein [Anaerolineales bacterium]